MTNTSTIERDVDDAAVAKRQITALGICEDNLFPEVDEYAAQEQALRDSWDC